MQPQKILLIICWLLCIHIVVAQDINKGNMSCLSQDKTQMPLYNKSSYRAGMRALEEQYKEQKFKRKGSLRESAEDTLYIPVIVHIVHNGQPIGTDENISSAQVYSQLDVLNEDFNRKSGTPGFNNLTVGGSLKIKFVPAVKDPNGNILSEPGIRRYLGGRISWNSIRAIENILKPATQYDPNKYLNIWCLRFGGTISSTLGYAQFPVSTLAGLELQPDESATDGVVIRYNAFGRVGNIRAPYNGGRTTTHEVGHFLGLLHIWGDEENCLGTDYCDDTPQTFGPIYGCPSSPASCLANVPALFNDYMDYTNDACMNLFTQDQIARMRFVLEHSPRRASLTRSEVYKNEAKPLVRFSVFPEIVCQGQQVILSDSTLNTPTQWTWRVYDSAKQEIALFNTQNPLLVLTTTGQYDVSLVATNALGKDSLYIPHALNVITTASIQLPVVIDAENQTNFYFYAKYGDSLPTITTLGGAYGLSANSFYIGPKSSTVSKTYYSGIFTPMIQFTSITGAYLEFDYAYGYVSGPTHDTLYVQVSNNCGRTFTTIYKMGGSVLATTNQNISQPASDQWRKASLYLPFLDAQTEVMFRILFRQNKGNPLWIDNLQIKKPVYTQVPIANFEVIPSSICVGDMVMFSDKSQNYPTSWIWTIQVPEREVTLITTTLQNPQIWFQIPGEYTVSLQSSNPLGSSALFSEPGALTVHPLPIIQIRVNPRFDEQSGTCTGYVISATGAAQYTWYDGRGNNPIGSGDRLIVRPLENTTYKLVSTSMYGCKSEDTLSLQLCQLTDSKPQHDTAPFVPYPNPTKDMLYLGSKRGFGYTILNVLLQHVEKGYSENNYISVAFLPAGMYTLLIEYPGQKPYYVKFIREN